MPSIKAEALTYDVIRAILDGHKTAIRRPVKFSGHKVSDLLSSKPTRSASYAFSAYNCRTGQKVGVFLKPRHRFGGIIYVRESYAEVSSLSGVCDTDGLVFMSDFSPADLRELKEKGFRWKPPILMPKEYARIFLRVKRVWPEHLNDISENCAIREGIYKYQSRKDGKEEKYTFNSCENNFYPSAVNAFSEFWDSTILSPDLPIFGWSANPMVWAYEFEVISREEALGERRMVIYGKDRPDEAD